MQSSQHFFSLQIALQGPCSRSEIRDPRSEILRSPADRPPSPQARFGPPSGRRSMSCRSCWSSEGFLPCLLRLLGFLRCTRQTPQSYQKWCRVPVRHHCRGSWTRYSNEGLPQRCQHRCAHRCRRPCLLSRTPAVARPASACTMARQP